MKKTYIVIVIVLIAVGGYYWYKSSTTSQTQTQYVTEDATKGTITSSVSGSGNVIVDQLATVDPTISGTVANLSVNVGDKVEKGQLLFEIVNDQLSVNVSKSIASQEQSGNAVDSAKVTKKSAEADYYAAIKKNKTTPGSFTKRQLDVLKKKIDVAENGIEAAQKSLDSSNADLANQQSIADERSVTAPISGIVNEINVKNGDDLGKSSSNSTTSSPIVIGDLSTLKAQVAVSEVDIANVSVGQKAMLTFDSLNGLSVSGKVEKIDSLGTLSQGVVTYNVTIGLDTLDERIKPQMSVSASIITAVKQDAIIIQSGALKTQNGVNTVEILRGQTPQEVNVEVGISNNTETEITSGVSEGDKIVTKTINGNSNSSNTNKNTNSASRPGGGGGGLHLPGFGGGPRD